MLNDKDQNWVYEVCSKITKKMAAVSERSRNKIPSKAVNGVHDDRSDNSVSWRADDGINWWTNGFWGGMLWMMYHETGEERYAEIARISEVKLDQCFVDYYGLHHDVGFMWIPTAVTDYRLTGNADARRRAMHAASLLAGRFNVNGSFIRAWNDIPGSLDDTRGWAIIDSLFNIPLLCWASDETGDPRFAQIAMRHADKLMEFFIRPDGSARHIVEFDIDMGEFVRDYGGQGYERGSSWTRGQAWALYGFLISYLHTKEKRYLDTAKRVADYFVAHIPEDGLIPVDFCQPTDVHYEDSIAAACASCGLIELSKVLGEAEGEVYMQAALLMLKALDKKRTTWDVGNDGILTHCTGAYHSAVKHENYTYGDMFFMEAMFKLKGHDVFKW